MSIRDGMCRAGIGLVVVVAVVACRGPETSPTPAPQTGVRDAMGAVARIAPSTSSSADPSLARLVSRAVW